MTPIDQAFVTIDRADFLRPAEKPSASDDRPLPIGYGQTNSQPSTVRQMLEWLDPRPGNRVLDVGSGSGWTTALLAHLVGPAGSVRGTELVPALVSFGRRNLAKYDLPQANICQAGEELGCPQEAPYDCILVSAGAERLPEALLAQLRPGGRAVVPVGNEILVVETDQTGQIQAQSHYGYSFVPLITK